MLAGFAYHEISTPTYNQTDNAMTVRFAYLAATTTTMGLGLIIVVISSLSTIFGAGLALRGNKGSNSVDLAVKTMEEEFNISLKFFIMQLTIFFTSLFFKSVILLRFSLALAVNGILLVFLVLFIKKGYQIFDLLYVPDREAISGEFKGQEMEDNYPAMKMANQNTFFGKL